MVSLHDRRLTLSDFLWNLAAAIAFAGVIGAAIHNASRPEPQGLTITGPRCTAPAEGTVLHAIVIRRTDADGHVRLDAICGHFKGRRA
ncbi:MAG TPA: hypothetical protein VN667_17105 [Burkholderiales bacterium]|nr:hypothetical protein [Burkholderiales bacterium]